MGSHRLGVDIGGTFTDAVMMNEDSGEISLVKMASTPRDPSLGFMNVVERTLMERGVEPGDISYIVHGTTVVTNTIIEGKGARTALIATEGFRDVFEIARQIRPKLYDIFCEKPPPLVPRYLCYGVPERLNYAGEVLKGLDEDAVRTVVRQLANEQVESVVVCLLHSYANPVHERRVGEILRQEMPGVYISLSADLCPEMREYFRASTTAVNGVVLPVVNRYLGNLEERLIELGAVVDLHLMTSAGGIVSSKVARQEPVHLIESGPAAGMIAATAIGELAGIKNLISFDMGGTTAKAGLVEEGTPRIAADFEVGSAAVAESRGAGYPVRSPVVDLVEIGAGGGSIAWIDAGGALRVGPKSAGADPGPACYGKGQKNPCITDANLLLGRINADYFIGGEQQLWTAGAAAAVQDVAGQIGKDMIETAHGIIEIANANMVGALRLISVQRGFDPRDFVLVAYGGAGPMHANALARELQIPKVLIPPSPGGTSALGLLVSDIKHDYVFSYIQPMEGIDFSFINQRFCKMEEEALQLLAAEGIAAADMHLLRAFDMRYVGQSFELKVETPSRELVQSDSESLNASFFKDHKRAYGFADHGEPTEVINLRLTAIGKIKKPSFALQKPEGENGENALKGKREVYFSEAGGMVPCKIYDRYKLRCGNKVDGPAIVEEVDSTVVVHPHYKATVDPYGNIFIEGVSQW